MVAGVVHFTEYDDDRYWSRRNDHDDYDEADEALRQQSENDGYTSWKIQVHELCHAMRESPLPGTTLPQEVRKRFKVSLPPFPLEPTVGQLRNLFNDASYENAQKCARSKDSDIRWFGAIFLLWRTTALGRYCANVNCLKPLPIERPKRGPKRFFCYPLFVSSPEGDCWRSCKEAQKKRRAYHKKHPNRGERLHAMLVPGVPFSIQPDRRKLPYRGGWLGPRETAYSAPWVDADSAASTNLDAHFRRLESRIRSRRSDPERKLKLQLKDIIEEAIAEGHILSDEEQQLADHIFGESEVEELF